MPSTLDRRTYCYSFHLSKVNHSSMRKLKDLFYMLFLMNPLYIQVQPLLEDHVNAISKHVCGTPIFNKEHLKPNAKCFLLNYPNIVVWVMS